jgi:hypothetical protein
LKISPTGETCFYRVHLLLRIFGKAKELRITGRKIGIVGFYFALPNLQGYDNLPIDYILPAEVIGLNFVF